MSIKKGFVNQVVNEDVDAMDDILKEKNSKIISNPVVSKRIKRLYFEPVEVDKVFYEFYYNPYIKNKFDMSVPEVLNYYLDLKKKLALSLNIPAIIKEFQNQLYIYDKVNLKTTDDEKAKLPRYIKMIRLQQFYDLLIEIGLKLIHNYFWVDDVKLIDSAMTIKECIELAIPQILYLKNSFEDNVNDELVFTNDELKMLKN